MRTLYGLVTAVVLMFVMLVGTPTKAHAQQACLAAEQQLITDEQALSLVADSLSADYALLQADEADPTRQWAVPGDLQLIAFDQARYNNILQNIATDQSIIAGACPHGH